MGFSHDLVPKFFVLRDYKSVLEPKNTLLIDSKMLRLLFLHLSFDVENTHISLLKLDDSTSKRAINSDIVEHNRMREMGQMKIFDNQRITMRFPTQGISNNICLTRMIMHLNIIVLDQL
jgi:hypothetical protein